MLLPVPERSGMDGHVGEFASWLRQGITARGLSQNAVSDRARIGRGAISEYLSGKRLPDVESLERLADFLDGDVATLREMVDRDRASQRAERWVTEAVASSPSLVRQIVSEVAAQLIPLLRLQRATADDLARWGEPLLVESFAQPASAARRGGMGSMTGDRGEQGALWRIRVSGGCMEPRIPAGSDVIVDPRADPRIGDVVIAIVDDEPVLKVLDEIDGRPVLVADDGTMLAPDAEARVIGVVCYVPLRRG